MSFEQDIYRLDYELRQIQREAIKQGMQGNSNKNRRNEDRLKTAACGGRKSGKQCAELFTCNKNT